MSSRLNATTTSYGNNQSHKVVGGAVRWLATLESRNAQQSHDESDYIDNITADIATEDTKVAGRTVHDRRIVTTRGRTTGQNELHFAAF